MAEYELGKKNMVSPQVLGTVLGLSGERIRQLADEGVFEVEMKGRNRKLDLFPSIQTYVEYLKKQITPTRNLDDESRKDKAEADLKEAKAEIEAIKRDELLGMMHRSEDVEEVYTTLVMKIRSELLALPGAVAMDAAEAKTAQEASGVIKNSVNNVLNRLAEFEYDPKQYKKLVREREKWMNDDAGESEETE